MSPSASLLALLLAAAPGEDPRIPLVEHQLAGRTAEALSETERLLATQPDVARGLGLDYLRGHLLELLGRTQEATNAFLTALSTAPGLAVHIYYRLAMEHERLGHPEMAAGLVAKVINSDPPFANLDAAVRLLRRALALGGDCRLLGGIRAERLEPRERRQIQLARAECALRQGDLPRSAEIVAGLLRESRGDDAAYEAARISSERFLEREPETGFLLSIGITLHQHRDFERSSQLLDRAFATAELPQLLETSSFDQRYARARNDFWVGNYRAAAAAFGALAERTVIPDKKSDALYQEGRCHELVRDWTRASASFRRAYLADPQGEWGPQGLLAAIRIEWRAGNEASALEALRLLLASRAGRDQAARAALFLAVSDLAQGRGDRAAAWLAQAERLGAGWPSELAYWRGRLAEIAGDRGGAVLTLAGAIRREPGTPFSEAARERLEMPGLAPTARELGGRLAASDRTEDLLTAAILLGERHPRSAAVWATLAQRFAQDPGAAPFLRFTPVPVRAWPLWSGSHSRPEEVLLALGLFDEGAPAVARYFPVSSPSLALTAGHHLAEAGATARALRIAETLEQRIPAGLPPRLLAGEYRRLLYPLPFADILVPEAERKGVDPSLLAAIIREESRFDPTALSDASARGLTQFTQQTAERFAGQIGRVSVGADDLYRPQVSIALGATYVAELLRDFKGAEHLAVAAYNAGEDAARLFQSYCFTKDPAEFYSKVGFRQTRAYVVKVLSSRGQYREIYPGGRTTSTMGGKSR